MCVHHCSPVHRHMLWYPRRTDLHCASQRDAPAPLTCSQPCTCATTPEAAERAAQGSTPPTQCPVATPACTCAAAETGDESSHSSSFSSSSSSNRSSQRGSWGGAALAAGGTVRPGVAAAATPVAPSEPLGPQHVDIMIQLLTSTLVELGTRQELIDGTVRACTCPPASQVCSRGVRGVLAPLLALAGCHGSPHQGLPRAQLLLVRMACLGAASCVDGLPQSCWAPWQSLRSWHCMLCYLRSWHCMLCYLRSWHCMLCYLCSWHCMLCYWSSNSPARVTELPHPGTR